MPPVKALATPRFWTTHKADRTLTLLSFLAWVKPARKLQLPLGLLFCYTKT